MQSPFYPANVGGAGKIRVDNLPINVKEYGAKGDGVTASDGAITASGNTFTSAGAAFSASDVGKPITVAGAGAAGVPLATTIAGFTSGTEIELTDAAVTTVSGAAYIYGTDDTVAFESSLSALAAGGELRIGVGTFLVSKAAARILTVPSGVRVRGIKGKTIVKILSATQNTSIFGSASLVEDLTVEDVVFDGSSDVVANFDTIAFEFPNIERLHADGCKFTKFTLDGMLLGEDTRAEDVSIFRSQFDNISQNGVRYYNNRRARIIGCRFFDFVKSPVDTNPTTLSDDETVTVIRDNYFKNDAVGWVSGQSTISLLGDRNICEGNTIIGGGEIVVHATFTRNLFDYKITGNTIQDTYANGITINQDVNLDMIVANNTIKGCVGSPISVVNGGLAGTSDRTTVISGNILEEGAGTYALTDFPASIRLVGANNVKCFGNNIKNPRMFGIVVGGDAYDISINGNDVTGHKGQAPTDTTTRYGHAIGVIEFGTTTVRDVFIEGNYVRDFMTDITPTVAAQYASGIGISGSGTSTDIQGVSIYGNKISKGNGVGVSLKGAYNCDVFNNDIMGAFGTHNIDSGTTLTIRHDLGISSIPTTGSHRLGAKFYNSAPASAGHIGWACTQAGTFGTLSSVTGSITSGENSLVVNDASALLIGQIIRVAGVAGTREIMSIDGTTVYLSSNADATVSGAAVSFEPVVFKTFGVVS